MQGRVVRVDVVGEGGITLAGGGGAAVAGGGGRGVDVLVMDVRNVVLDGTIGFATRAADMLDIAAWMLLSAAALNCATAAACEASKTAVEVTVDCGWRVEPDASTVMSWTLLTVLLGGGISDRISVDVAAPGSAVTTLVDELEVVVVIEEGSARLPNRPSRSEAMAAPGVEVPIEEVLDFEPEIKLVVLLLEIVLIVGRVSPSGPSRATVTVCVTSACA